MEKVEVFQEDKLKIQVEELQYLIKITWLGECTLRDPSPFLNPILKEQYKISLTKNKRMVLDFTKTKYMNSAAIIPIIQILKTIKTDKGSIQVTYSLFERWQKVLIGELKIFETDDNRIQVIGVEHQR